MAIFALAMASVYLKSGQKTIWITLLPGLFYTFIVISYICHAPIGLGLELRLGPLLGIDSNSYLLSYLLGTAAAILYMVLVIKQGRKSLNQLPQSHA